MFWFRELLTNNCIQPRDAIEIEGRTKTFQTMGPLNVSFVKSAGLLRRIVVSEILLNPDYFRVAMIISSDQIKRTRIFSITLF